MNKARYIMLGGFLGAGKTTAVAKLAERLTAQGLRVGLITNDQGKELVDTAMLRSRGFATEEIPGGCFCCRFNSLVDAADKLKAESRPEVFIAEPVGSCTDLVATVTYPLRRMYGDQFLIAPLSVLVDPIRAQRVLGLTTGGQFSEKVLYIYRKQLEEADLIVINKRELLDTPQLDRLRLRLSEEFPRAKVLAVSARTGAGIDDWFNQITASEQVARVAMDVDYEVYAEGEALLGWLNATVTLSNQKGFDGNQVIRDLADTLRRLLVEAGAEVAHLKMTLEPEDAGLGDLADVARAELLHAGLDVRSDRLLLGVGQGLGGRQVVEVAGHGRRNSGAPDQQGARQDVASRSHRGFQHRSRMVARCPLQRCRSSAPTR